MSVVLVTGSAGLIGAETVRFSPPKVSTLSGSITICGVFCLATTQSTAWSRERLQVEVKSTSTSTAIVRDSELLESVFNRKGADFGVIHTAAQPSHDWAARDPQTDFGINANGTLNLLEATRRHCPDAPSYLPARTKSMATRPTCCRWSKRKRAGKCGPTHPFAAHGIDESMSIDGSLHSLFGASKLAAISWSRNTVVISG